MYLNTVWISSLSTWIPPYLFLYMYERSTGGYSNTLGSSARCIGTVNFLSISVDVDLEPIFSNLGTAWVFIYRNLVFTVPPLELDKVDAFELLLSNAFLLS